MDPILRLRELMNSRGWSEYRLAKESKLSMSTISNIFHRGSIPSIPTLETLCNTFGISLGAAFHQVIHGESQAVAEIADVLLCGGSMERTSGSCLSADRHVVLNLENAPEVVSIPTSWLRGAAPKGRGGE